MRLQPLAKPRQVVLHDDEAWGDPFQNPGKLAADASDESKAKHETALARFAKWERYLATYDLSVLDGEKRGTGEPIVFTVADLSPEQWAFVGIDARSAGYGGHLVDLVALGVVDIKNLPTDDKGGVWECERVRDKRGWLRLPDDVMRMIAKDTAALLELGNHVYRMRHLIPEAAKSG